MSGGWSEEKAKSRVRGHAQPAVESESEEATDNAERERQESEEQGKEGKVVVELR